MTRANQRTASFRRAMFLAAPLTLVGLFAPTLEPAAAQQTLLQYDQAAGDRAATPPTTAMNSPYGVPSGVPQGRYAAGAATNPYAAPTSAAAPAADGNPFLRIGRPRSTLLNAVTNATATAAAATGPTAGSRYPSVMPTATQPNTLQPVASSAAAMQPLVPVPSTSPTSPRYDDQVRPASFDVPPTVPMTPTAPMTPAATVGGPALAVAPNESRYTQPDARYGDRYAPNPAGPTSPYSQQQTQPIAQNIQTAANLPVQPAGGPTAAPQPLVATPQHLSGLAILRQKPLDENAARMQHPLTPLVAWLEDAMRQMDANVRDYTCTFKKREFVDGKLQEQQSMFVKMRMQPYSVYFYFLDPSVQGQEALYVAGKNNGNLLAHPTGIKQALVGTLSLAPNDPQAMDGNRYPITDFGFRRLAERFLERSKYEMQFGECNVRVIENARVNDRMCTCVEAVHPVKRAEFRYNICRIYIDNELNLPIRCEGYDWPDRAGGQPQLIEEYTYSNLKLNVGLGDMDFDQANPQYTFK